CDIVRRVRRERVPLVEGAIDSRRYRDNAKVAERAHARVFTEGHHAPTDTKWVDRRQLDSERFPGRRSKIADDEQDGRCADRNLDRREGESDTRRDWSSLSEQAGTVRQAERSRNVRGGGASNFHLE